MNASYRACNGIALALGVASLGTTAFADDRTSQGARIEVAEVTGQAPNFKGISNWLNSAPLNMSDLRGKVVMVNFWTYGCYNCVNTLPHVTKLHAKYKDKGLVIVGVHTPEFPFEKSTEQRAGGAEAARHPVSGRAGQ